MGRPPPVEQSAVAAVSSEFVSETNTGVKC